MRTTDSETIGAQTVRTPIALMINANGSYIFWLTDALKATLFDALETRRVRGHNGSCAGVLREVLTTRLARVAVTTPDSVAFGFGSEPPVVDPAQPDRLTGRRVFRIENAGGLSETITPRFHPLRKYRPSMIQHVRS